MLKHIYSWYQAIEQKIAMTIDLLDDFNRHDRANHSPRLHPFQREHHKRVAEFHKNHVAKLVMDKNGNGMLVKWERFVYNKGKAFIKMVKQHI